MSRQKVENICQKNCPGVLGSVSETGLDGLRGPFQLYDSNISIPVNICAMLDIINCTFLDNYGDFNSIAPFFSGFNYFARINLNILIKFKSTN